MLFHFLVSWIVPGAGLWLNHSGRSDFFSYFCFDFASFAAPPSSCLRFLVVLLLTSNFCWRDVNRACIAINFSSVAVGVCQRFVVTRILYFVSACIIKTFASMCLVPISCSV